MKNTALYPGLLNNQVPDREMIVPSNAGRSSRGTAGEDIFWRIFVEYADPVVV